MALTGRADILVNNAGVIRRADPLEFSEKDWDDVINVNLKTYFFLAQAFARRLVAQGGGGKIVNIASVLAFQGGIRIPSYTASKHGVAGLTRLLANEWAAKGINVNAIAPGLIMKEATMLLTNEASRQAALAQRAIQKLGEPEDLAGTLIFLASPDSDWISGQTIVVDGGMVMRL